jgi:hypothetical protein
MGPDRIADEMAKAKKHAGTLREIDFSEWSERKIEDKFGELEKRIRITQVKGTFEKRLPNYVQLVENLAKQFGNTLR